jgi:hypothetical protein
MSGALGQGSYTRTMGAPVAGRDSTFPRFHTEAVQDPVASAAAGRPIYTSQERVQIINPGNPNQPVFDVTDAHRNRWPEQYKLFLSGQEVSMSGTPIEQWSILNRGHVLELKGMDIHTIEQCAGLSDLALQRLGMLGAKLRDLAKAYLDESEQMAITTAALARAEAAESRIAALEQSAKENRLLLDQVHAELMRVKALPSSVDAYIPGDHDPMQAHNRPQLMQQPVAQSSLETLVAPRPRKRAEA